MEVKVKSGCCPPQGVTTEYMEKIAACLTVSTGTRNPRNIQPSIDPPKDVNSPWLVLDECGHPTGKTLNFSNGKWC